MKKFLGSVILLTIISTSFSQSNMSTVLGDVTNSVINPIVNSTYIDISSLKSEQLNLKDIPSLIGSLSNTTEVCITRLRNLMSYMSEGEQTAFYNAYLDLKKNSNSSENYGRCFSPSTLKKVFKTIAKGNMNQIAANMTSNSQKMKASFSCLKKALDKIGTNVNYQQPVTDFVNAQANSNQCMATFVKTLYENLASRRRYLLLNSADINSTATTKDGGITGFNFIQTEANNITKSFLTFANCYQALPDTLTKTFSEVLSLVSQDAKCSSNTTRLLQTETNPNNTSNTPSSGTNITTIPSSTSPVISASGSPAPSGSGSPKPSGSGSSAPSSSGSAPKNSKKSLGKLSLSQIDITWLDNISTNLNQKTGDYQTVGKLFTDLQSVDLKSKCNLVNQVNSYLNNPGNQIQNLIDSEMNKVKKNSACFKSDYLIYIKKDLSSTIGSISCNDADSTCTNASLNFKNLDNTSFQFASGCSSNTRFAFVYMSSSNLGNFFDLISSGLKTCKTGAAKDCAKQLANLNTVAKSLKFLQSSTTAPSSDSSCVPPMKKTCNDVIYQECQNSNLLNNISTVAPSATDSALPDACQNIDPETPDYISCFNWINDNLIIYTLFPNMKNINNIQSLITASQKTISLRELQSSSVSIVALDASSKDTVAQLSPDQYTVSSADIAIDGANPDSISLSATSTQSIDIATSIPATNNSNSGLFTRYSNILILILALLI